MMITFTTKHWAPITYLQSHGEQLLQLIGYPTASATESDLQKSAGVLPAETIRAALASLDQSCLAYFQAQLDKTKQQAAFASPPQDLDPDTSISLATRAYPLIELLRVARDYNQPVIWQQVEPTRL